MDVIYINTTQVFGRAFLELDDEGSIKGKYTI